MCHYLFNSSYMPSPLLEYMPLPFYSSTCHHLSTRVHAITFFTRVHAITCFTRVHAITFFTRVHAIAFFTRVLPLPFFTRVWVTCECYLPPPGQSLMVWYNQLRFVWL